MKKHTTEHGDQFLQTHINNNSPWYQEAYREDPARLDAYDRAANAFLTWSGVIAGVLILLTIITVLSVP